MKEEGTVIFSVKDYQYLKHELLNRGDFIDGLLGMEEFPDGERYRRLLTAVRGRSAVHVGG